MMASNFRVAISFDYNVFGLMLFIVRRVMCGGALARSDPFSPLCVLQSLGAGPIVTRGALFVVISRPLCRRILSLAWRFVEREGVGGAGIVTCDEGH